MASSNRYDVSDQLTSSHWSHRITLLPMRSFISQQQMVEGLPDGKNKTSTDFNISRLRYNFTVIVGPGDELKPDFLTHFWRSTGFW